MKVEINEIPDTLKTHTHGHFKKIIEPKSDFSKNNTLALKGIAIIMLIFYHCFRIKTAQVYNVSFFPFNQDIMIKIISTFKICVSIFAFITGYGLILSLKKLNTNYDWTNKQISKWIVDRLTKTLSGFWIIAILAYIICQIINGRTGDIFFSDGIGYGIVKIIIDFFGLSDLFGINKFCTTWWYMSIAILFVFSVPIFAKLFKKYGYMLVLFSVIIIPRILGWKYSNSSYITFLFPVLLGMICAENNLMVKVANLQINKNVYINKIIKFIIESIIIVALYKVYNYLPADKFWEIRYAIIPFCLMCYLYEFYLDLPIIKHILEFLGKYSMDIFLIHTFLRSYYMQSYIYSFGNFIKIAVVLLGMSLIISIILELFKKLIRYDKIINNVKEKINNNMLGEL